MTSATNTAQKVLVDNLNHVKYSEDIVNRMFGPIQIPEAVQQNIPWRSERLKPSNFKSVYNTADEIKFQFPQTGIIDPRTIRLSFNLRISNSSSSVSGTIVINIQNVFSRARITVNDITLSDTQEYGFLSRILDCIVSDGGEIQRSPVGQFRGQGTLASYDMTQRSNYHGTGGRTVPYGVPRRYTIPVLHGLLCQDKPLLLDAFKGCLTLGLTVANGLAFTTHNTTSFTLPFKVEITSPTLLCTIQDTFSEMLSKQLVAMVKSSRLVYGFDHWEYNRFNLPSTAMRFTASVPIHGKWLKRALAVIRSESDYFSQNLDATQTYDCLNASTGGAGGAFTPKVTSIKQYQWKYMGTNYPPDPILCHYYNVPELSTLNVGYSAIGLTHTTPPTDAWYHLEQAFNVGHSMYTGDFSNKFGFGHLDPNSTSAPTAYFDVVSGNRAPTMFYMVGKFFDIQADGEIRCLSGGNGGEELILTIDFNGTSTYTTTPMYLEVFTDYHRIATVHDKGIDVVL